MRKGSSPTIISQQISQTISQLEELILTSLRPETTSATKEFLHLIPFTTTGSISTWAAEKRLEFYSLRKSVKGGGTSKEGWINSESSLILTSSLTCSSFRMLKGVIKENSPKMVTISQLEDRLCHSLEILQRTTWAGLSWRGLITGIPRSTTIKGSIGKISSRGTQRKAIICLYTCSTILEDWRKMSARIILSSRINWRIRILWTLSQLSTRGKSFGWTLKSWNSQRSKKQ